MDIIDNNVDKVNTVKQTNDDTNYLQQKLQIRNMLLNNKGDNKRKETKNLIDKKVSNMIQNVEKENIVHFDDSMHGNKISEELSDAEGEQINLKLTK